MPTPTLSYWSWPRAIPQLLTILLITTTFWVLLPDPRIDIAMLLGAGTYLLYSYTSRYFIPRAHRQGLAALRDKNYDSAIQLFWESYEFFSANPWLDQYRPVTMMTPTIWSYREMALMNIGTCYLRLKNFEAATTTYSRLLLEYPDNEAAIEALELLDPVSGDWET